MAIATEIERLQTAKAELKTAIESKGVQVPASAKLDDYAEYVEDIEQGATFDKIDFSVVTWGNLTNEQFTKFFLSGLENIKEITDTTLGTSGTMNTAIQYTLPQLTKFVSVNINRLNVANAVGYLSYLEELRLPNCNRIGAGMIRNLGSLKTLELGNFSNWNWTNFLNSSCSNLRLFLVAQNTNVDLPMTMWDATNVIAEGETAQLELIANAQLLLARLYDHSNDGVTKTCQIGWISTLVNSEYESVQDALLTLQLDAFDKGWDFI